MKSISISLFYCNNKLTVRARQLKSGMETDGIYIYKFCRNIVYKLKGTGLTMVRSFVISDKLNVVRTYTSVVSCSRKK
jgi:hypothetical protein